MGCFPIIFANFFASFFGAVIMPFERVAGRDTLNFAFFAVEIFLADYFGVEVQGRAGLS